MDRVFQPAAQTGRQARSRASSFARTEHKARWDEVHDAVDRTEYIEWLLRESLGWRADFRAGDQLPEVLAAGIAEQGVTVVPDGAYFPASPSPVGVLGDFSPDKGEAATV